MGEFFNREKEEVIENKDILYFLFLSAVSFWKGKLVDRVAGRVVFGPYA